MRSFGGVPWFQLSDGQVALVHRGTSSVSVLYGCVRYTWLWAAYLIDWVAKCLV